MADGEGAGPRRLDLSEALRSKTQRTTLAALEKKGFKKVNVLNMKTIEKIVSEAVEKSLDRRDAHVSGEEREKLEADARSEFLKLLKEHKKVVAQKNLAEGEKSKLGSQLDALRAELEAQTARLNSERARSIDQENWTLSPSSFSKLEGNIRTLFGQLMNDERRKALAEVGPGALRGLSELERRLLEIIDRILIEERERFLSTVQSEHEKKVGLLERRVAKLSQTLSETEDALRTVYNAKTIDGGIASIYKVVQGLNLDDSFLVQKKELLKEVFVQNLVLQKKKIDEADKEGVRDEVLEHMQKEAEALARAEALEALEASEPEPAVPAAPVANWDLSHSAERAAYVLSDEPTPKKLPAASGVSGHYWESPLEPLDSAEPLPVPPRPRTPSGRYWEIPSETSLTPSRPVQAPMPPSGIREPSIDLPTPVEPLVTETGF